MVLCFSGIGGFPTATDFILRVHPSRKLCAAGDNRRQTYRKVSVGETVQVGEQHSRARTRAEQIRGQEQNRAVSMNRVNRYSITIFFSANSTFRVDYITFSRLPYFITWLSSYDTQGVFARAGYMNLYLGCLVIL